MDINASTHLGTCNITLNGPFSFGDHAEFRNILGQFEVNDVDKVVLHMEGIQSVDSAALGMLLLALDESKKHNKQLVLRGANGQVKKMFDMAQFDTLFTMQN